MLRGVNPILDAAAIEGVHKWRYRAALVESRPVPVYLTVTINFKLN